MSGRACCTVDREESRQQKIRRPRCGRRILLCLLFCRGRGESVHTALLDLDGAMFGYERFWRDMSTNFKTISDSSFKSLCKMGKFWVRLFPLHAGGCFMKGSLHGIVIRVRIDVQRNAGVGMPHEILQTFHIDPGLLHIGAEGMPRFPNCMRSRAFPMRRSMRCSCWT